MADIASSLAIPHLKMNDSAVARRVRYQNISIAADLFHCGGMRVQDPTWNVNEVVYHCQSNANNNLSRATDRLVPLSRCKLGY